MTDKIKNLYTWKKWIFYFFQVTKLNQVSLSRIATGQVVNLLSNDVIRFDTVAMSLNILWIAPIILPVIIYFMWQEIGISSLIGICSLEVFSLPLQGNFYTYVWHKLYFFRLEHLLIFRRLSFSFLHKTMATPYIAFKKILLS